MVINCLVRKCRVVRYLKAFVAYVKSIFMNAVRNI